MVDSLKICPAAVKDLSEDLYSYIIVYSNMTPKLNNVEDGYFHNIYLLNSTQDAYDEIRTLIGSGGGASTRHLPPPLSNKCSTTH